MSLSSFHILALLRLSGEKEENDCKDNDDFEEQAIITANYIRKE